MDYQRFIQQLPALYEHWGRASAHPHSQVFTQVLAQIPDLTSTSIMQLLNYAVECMAAEEVYCQIDGITAASIIGTVINHPQAIAYLVAQSTEQLQLQQPQTLEQLTTAVSLYNLDEQVIFIQQEFEEFFCDLRQVATETKIGVYVYAGAHDYRSQLLALQLVKPFLAQTALIIAFGSKYSTAQQAHWDFLATTPQAQLLLNLPATVNGTWDEGVQIFSWDVAQQNIYDWSTLTANFRSDLVIQFLKNNAQQLLQTVPEMLATLEPKALQLERKQQIVAAADIYQQILKLQHNHPSAYYSLGMINFQMQRYEQAHLMLLNCLSIDDSEGNYHYSLGLILEKLGLIEQAVNAYQTAITLNPELVNVYNDLGNLLCRIDQTDEAELIYRQAIAVHPAHFGSYLNLGNLLMSKHQIDAAIAYYEKSLEFSSFNPDILHNLGVAFATKNEVAKSHIYLGQSAYGQGKYKEAIFHYQSFLKHQNGDIYIYINLVNCYKELQEDEAAVQVYESAIKQHPYSAELYVYFIIDLQNFGKVEKAIEVGEAAIKILPEEISLRLENARLMPILYEQAQEIDFYRIRFTNFLKKTIQTTKLTTASEIEKAFNAISIRTNFFLSYQGKNDVELQSLYGNFVHRIMVAKYVNLIKQLTKQPLVADKKVRVGYVSSHFRNHTVGKLTLGWLKNHHQENFEIYCYYLENKQDSTTQQFRFYSDVFYQSNLEEICQQIIADKLHIIVYTDIGMKPAPTLMAGLRLAPIQCTFWGHPVTSGSPTMDYYLSSELMEPENAQKHYSEKLILLPNLGICYSKPELPKQLKQRAEFQLKENDIVYLSCQSLYKYLPQYDYIFPQIAQHVQRAKFVFISSHISKSITKKLQQRLQKVFANFGMNSEDYCVILSRLIDHRDYLNLNLLSDIYLDTLEWSGGNTTLEAIACNLPIVTCPGEFMRGRHSYAILKMLGVTETIAKDEAEYIQIAVKLGLEQSWRETIVDKIKQNQDRVYEDQTCVQALETFYQRVVQEHQA
ncbi:MAG: tetratricopeptide repeat protein [Crinalium sp.]